MPNVKKAFSLIALASAILLLPATQARADDAAEQLAAISALFDAKKYPLAAQKLQAFLTAYPKHARAGAAAFTLGHCWAALEQWPRAAAAYEKAVAANDPEVTPEARLRLGIAATNAAQFDKAIPALEKAVEEDLSRAHKGAAYFWLGQANFQAGKFPAAEAAYEKVVTDFNKVDFLDSAMLGHGLSALRQGKADEARTRLGAMLQRFPQSEDRVRARLALAQLNVEAKRYPQARSGFEGVIADEFAKKTPDLVAAAEEGLIHVLLESGEYAAASTRIEETLKKLPAGDPQRSRASLALGHCRYRQKQYDPALAAYQEASKAADPATAGEGIYWAANVLLAQNKNAEAAAMFRDLPTKYPTHSLAAKSALKAGDAYAAAGRPDLAGAAYRLVVDKYGKTDQLADAQKGLNGLTGAISDPVQLAAAIKNLPADQRPAAQLRLARLYFDAKKYAEVVAPLNEIQQSTAPAALKADARYLAGLAAEARSAAPAATAAAFSEAVTLNPEAEWAAHAHSRLSWLQLELKQPAKAEAAASAALKLNPAADVAQEARLALVQAQLDQKKWDEAMDTSKALLEGTPSPDTVATVVFTQAWVSEQRGKPEEALPLWERLSTEFPKSTYAPEAMIRVGDARLKEEKYEEARVQYEALLKGFPTSPRKAEARFKMGSALYNLTKPAEAAVEFDAVAADKSAGEYQAESLYWAGVAHDKAGSKEKAVQRLQRLVTEFPKHSRVANARVRLAGLKAAGS